MAYNSHGHTPAAWTTVIIILAGFIVGAVGVVMQNWPLFWIGGVGLVVVGGIVGKVMQMMGLGQYDPQSKGPAGRPANTPASGEGSAG